MLDYSECSRPLILRMMSPAIAWKHHSARITSAKSKFSADGAHSFLHIQDSGAAASVDSGRSIRVGITW